MLLTLAGGGMKAWGQTTYTAGVIGTGTSTQNYPLPGYYGYQFDVYLYDADCIGF